MSYKFAIIGGDKRNIYLAEQLQSLGHFITLYGFDKHGIANERTLTETIDFADYIICATPFTKDNVFLNTPLTEEVISIHYFLDKVDCKKTIFAGAIDDNLIKKKNFVDILKTEGLTKATTIATVEGAIKIAIENTDISLYDSNILVIGYGKIGSYLAKTLRNLGANVTVATRSTRTIEQAIKDDFLCYSQYDIDRVLSNKNIIFNTAPFIQIDNNNLDLIHKDCIYIELASKPFGINYEHSLNTNTKVIFGLSLPGIVSPKTIGTVLSNEILKKVEVIANET